MKIISKISLTRMKLMVQNTQIAGKNLFPIDHAMNINQFRSLSKTTFSFIIQRPVIFYFLSKRNYKSIKMSLIQSFREFLSIFSIQFSKLNTAIFDDLLKGHRIVPNARFAYIANFILIHAFSLHLFNNYGKNKECVDMELTYFLECTSLAKTGRLSAENICTSNGKFISLLSICFDLFDVKSDIRSI